MNRTVFNLLNFVVGGRMWAIIGVFGMLPLFVLSIGVNGLYLALFAIIAPPLFWHVYGRKKLDISVHEGENRKKILDMNPGGHAKVEIEEAQAQLDTIIISYWPDNVKRRFNAMRRSQGGWIGAVGAMSSNLVTMAPMAVLRYHKWRVYEDEHWKVILDRYYNEGLFPMLDEVMAEIAMIPGLEQAEIDALNQHRVVWGRKKIIKGIQDTYSMRKAKLETAERILMEDTGSTKRRFRDGEITLDQAKKDIRESLDRANRLYESAVPSLTAIGAGRYFWTTANGK